MASENNVALHRHCRRAGPRSHIPIPLATPTPSGKRPCRIKCPFAFTNVLCSQQGITFYISGSQSFQFKISQFVCRMALDTTVKAHSHRASTPTLSVHTSILFFTSDMMLTATLMLTKIKTCWIYPREHCRYADADARCEWAFDISVACCCCCGICCTWCEH